MLPSGRCILSTLFLTAITVIVDPLSAAAQTQIELNGFNVSTYTDGTLFVPPSRITQNEFDELAELVGLPPEGGSASTEQICAAIIKKIPTLLLPLANLGSFFGLCESSDAIIQGELDFFYQESEEACLSQEGIGTSVASAHGCDWHAFWIKTCEYTKPSVPPTCDGIMELCKQVGASVTAYPPNPADNEPGVISGSGSIPGCSCTTSYVLISPITCAAPLPARVEL